MSQTFPRASLHPSTAAGSGALPSANLDIAVCAVFLVFYVVSAAANMTIFQLNRRKHYKFIISAALFGFSMARITTLTLRIAWATRQRNIRLALAAQIFVNAGILVIYVVNLILAQRILRAMQPQIGWNPMIRALYKVLFILIGGALAMVIVTVVVNVYTLNLHTRSICRDVQLAAITYLFIIACLPMVHIALALLLPTPNDAETFGKGSMTRKIIILSLSSCGCMLIAGFRTGTTWSPPRLVIDPPWYDSKPSFYVFNFTFEVLILGVLTISRIDKLFFVPDGCNRPGDYTRLARDSSDSEENSSEEK